MKKRVLILGAGQDASFLAEILLAEGSEVHLMHRRSSVDNLARVRHLLDRITIHQGDLLDFSSLLRILNAISPDEVYNEADQDNVGWSASSPVYTANVTYGGVAILLEAISHSGTYQPVRIFQPVSALMFGDAKPPQDERTPLAPRSPYACAKAGVFLLCKHYRREYGMHVSCGIMYNHCSPRRSEEYLLPKICAGAVRIARGLQEKLTLGCLDQLVDIGFAREYMEGAVMLLRQPQAEDWCVATGETFSIEVLMEMAFELAGVKGRPVENNSAFGPTTPALTSRCISAADSGWVPNTSAADMVEMLVAHYEREVDAI
jgi:GDPmannose 4,6-dehydratase